MKATTVLLTGASGFIGSHLTRHLVRLNYDVHIIVRPTSNLEILEDCRDRMTLHEHDGSTPGMFRIVETAKPTVVFHLASLFLAQHQPQDIEPLIRSNLTFATQLLEAMVANQIPYFVNTGTAWQHFNQEDYNPVCLYAATKQAFEAILNFYLETSNLKAITLKLPDTYGPKDPRKKLFSLLQRTAKSQTPLAMSPGEQLIDLVYIDDVIRTFALAAERLINGKVARDESYSVTSGTPIPLRELVQRYREVTGKTLDIQWGERPYREREVMQPWQGNVLPGWNPQVDLEKGIKRLEGIER